jgi:hypothetical protein
MLSGRKAMRRACLHPVASTMRGQDIDVDVGTLSIVPLAEMRDSLSRSVKSKTPR